MHQNQLGFRPGYSVDDCKYRLSQKVSEIFKAGLNHKYSIVFVDFKNAYNWANRELIYSFLK